MRGDELFPEIEGSLVRERGPWSVLAPDPASEPKQPVRPPWWFTALVVALALVAGALAGAVTSRQAGDSPAASPIPVAQPAAAPQLGTVSDLVEQLSRSVVYLSARTATLDDLLAPNPPPGTVTGVIVDERGYIVTTGTGVEKTGEIGVILADGRQLQGRVIRASPDNDVAIVKVDEVPGLNAIALGRSTDVRVGDPVIAIGNASSFGDAPVVAQGVATALHRKLPRDNLDGLVETDAKLDSAFAGGPLVNLAGQMIGLNVIAPSSGGDSFAIGIDSIRPFIDQVVQRKPPMTAGVKVATLTPGLATGLDVRYTKGVIVTEVRRPGPGEQAQLRTGDVIKEIDGQPVETEERFIRLVATGPQETPLKLAVLRGSQSLSLFITLAPIAGLE